MSKRLLVAAIAGLVAGVTAIIGSLLPWLSLSPPSGSDPNGGAQLQSINGVLASSGFMLAFSAGIAIAGGWLWAGSERRKGAVVLGVLGFAVGAYCVWVMVAMADAVGLGGYRYITAVKPGLYVTLAGALIGVAAGIIAARPERAAPPAIGETPASPVDAD